MRKLLLIFCILVSFVSYTWANKLTLTIVAGKEWSNQHIPQVAVWLEDVKGNYLRTIYVTETTSRNKWLFSLVSGRPESLPVWSHAAKHDVLPSNHKSQNDIAIDAATYPTPKNGTKITDRIENSKNFVLKVEVNKSFDYNGFYEKANTGVNGQPSIVFSSNIPAGYLGDLELNMVGTGAVDGNDGKIHDESTNLTSAKDIINSIMARVSKK